jgi:hypothetical protein
MDMETQIKNSIEKIIRIPLDFETKGNVSRVTLVRESGYVELYNKIGEAEIEEVLRQYPDFVDEWLLWSENTRSTPAWHFIKFEDGSYLVTYSNEGKRFDEITTNDKFEACAIYIKRQIETTRIFIINRQ